LIVNSFGSERLEKELQGLLPPSISNGIRVIPPPYGGDTAWFGAKLISNVSYLYLNDHQNLLV
jgi:actin-related protein 8